MGLLDSTCSIAAHWHYSGITQGKAENAVLPQVDPGSVQAPFGHNFGAAADMGA